MNEFGSDFVSEEPAATPGALHPSLDIVWIRPHQVAKRPFFGNFNFSVDLSDLVDGFDIWRKAPVNTQNLTIHDCPEGKEVEEIHELAPNVGRSVLFEDFVEEAVGLRYLSTLVISPEQCNLGRVADFQKEEVDYGFD